MQYRLTQELVDPCIEAVERCVSVLPFCRRFVAPQVGLEPLGHPPRLSSQTLERHAKTVQPQRVLPEHAVRA